MSAGLPDRAQTSAQSANGYDYQVHYWLAIVSGVVC